MWKMWKRITLTIISVLVIAFIFSNSLRNGTESSELSNCVSDGLETAINVVTNGGTAEQGSSAYITIDRELVRKLAHVAEFGLLGVVLAITYISFGGKNKHCYIPLVIGIVVAICDESIQIFVEDRGPAVRDVLIDTSGLVLGIIIVGVIALLVANKIKQKQNVDKLAE